MSAEGETPCADRVRLALEGIDRSVSVLVVGDSMLDRYVWGSVDRISPEAPVPVLRKARETARPGGAANVALNVAGLGARVSLISPLGNDKHGKELLHALTEAGIGVEHMCIASGIATTTKTRIVTGHQQVLRVDEDPPEGPLNGELGARIVAEATRALAAQPHAIILSDYDKGALNEYVCSELIRQAAELKIPVFVDPKGEDYRRYAGADVVTPNLKELERVTGVDRKEVNALIAVGQELVSTLEIGSLVLTRSADGLTLITRGGTLHSPARAREVFDVTGAGDTVIAVLTLARVQGLDWPDALRMANLAAGLVVQHRGAVPVDRAELLGAISPRKSTSSQAILALEELCEVADEWRRNGDRIVFTNGCFDILHAGHVRYLSAAAAEGDRLIVGLNSDGSTRRLKGDGRPINGQEHRAEVLAGLRAVDAVVVFDEATPINLIERLRPHVLVKGADYTHEEVVGSAEVESWGGRVVLAPYDDALSTTALIERIRH